MKKLIFAAIIGASATLFAASTIYDDLGDLRPEFDINDFWMTNDHYEMTVDTAVSGVITVDTATAEPMRAVLPLSFFDARWWTASSAEAWITLECPGLFFIVK